MIVLLALVVLRDAVRDGAFAFGLLFVDCSATLKDALAHVWADDWLVE